MGAIEDAVTYDGSLGDWWKAFKQDQPEAAFVAGITPGVQVPVALADMNEAAGKGSGTDYALAALGLIPGMRMVTKGKEALQTGAGVIQRARDYLIHHAPDFRRYDPRYAADTYTEGKKIEQFGRNLVGAGAAAETGNVASGAADYLKTK